MNTTAQSVEQAIGGDDPKIADVIRRIQKLLAIAHDQRGNEHLAASAAEKAQELLEKYNLDMAVLGQRGADSGKREDTRLAGGLYKWQRELWQGVAELHYCVYWATKGLKKGEKYEHRIVGRTVNVLSARMMAEYLQGAIERIAREEFENNPSLYFSRAAIAYREGMAARLAERLRRRRWDKEAEARKEKYRREREAAERGEAASVALTILDVADREREANDDFLYGEGYSARRKLRMSEHERSVREAQGKKAEDERRWREQNPELAAEEDRRREKEARAEEARWRRNANRRKERTFHEPAVRDPRYHDGVRRGDSISIDPQINEARRRGALPAGE